MATEFDYDVFLSHNSQDKPRVRRLAEKLREAGLRVWFDDWSIAHGEDIYLAIERGLEKARTLVLFLSRAAVGSEWVGLERSTALFRDPTGKGRRFLPVLLEDCPLPDALKRYRYLDLRDDSEESFARLLAVIKGEEPPPAAAPAATPPPATPPPATKPKRPRRPARQGAAEQKRQSIQLFALLSLGCFAAGVLLLWLLVAKAELLVGLGLEGRLYYLVLLPMGLAVAGFLFGVLRSTALYSGRVLNGKLEVGGPAVVFCLVVLGGFFLVSTPEPFSLTVFVRGEGSVHDIPLRNRGAVVLDLGSDRRRQPIGEQGEVHFTEIPERFRGQEVSISVETDGFAVADSTEHYRLTQKPVYVTVKPQAAALRGRVQDLDGRPVPGARLRLRDLEPTTSDQDGDFVLEVPGNLRDENLYLTASATGYEPWREQVVPGSNEVVVVLKRSG